MRKVMYSLNSLSEQAPGYFHCWAGTMQDAYAIIEDTTTGKMHRVNDDQFRFMTPPEKIEKVVKCAGCKGTGKVPGFGELGCEICRGTGIVEYTLEWLKPVFISNDLKNEIFVTLDILDREKLNDSTKELYDLLKKINGHL